MPSVQKGLVPPGLHPGRSHSRSPGAQQVLSSTRASLTLLLFGLQGQALRAGLLCLHCPLCRDIRAFLPRMFIMGIRIPFRLVSFCLAHNTGRGRRCAVSGPAPAVLALPCPVSLGFSFTHDLQKHWRKSRDSLYLQDGGAAQANQLFLSPSDSQHGRTTIPLLN